MGKCSGSGWRRNGRHVGAHYPPARLGRTDERSTRDTGGSGLHCEGCEGGRGEWRQLLIGLTENTPPVWANRVAAHRPVEFFFFFLKIG